MNEPPAPRRRHRAVVLVLLMLASVGFLLFTFPAAAMFTGRNGIALLVVVAGAAIGGIAFSWGRYFGRK